MVIQGCIRVFSWRNWFYFGIEYYRAKSILQSRLLIPHIEEMAETRFGVEVFLNGLFSKKETKKVPLPGLVGLFKYEKESPQDAFSSYIKAV